MAILPAKKISTSKKTELVGGLIIKSSVAKIREHPRLHAVLEQRYFSLTRLGNGGNDEGTHGTRGTDGVRGEYGGGGGGGKERATTRDTSFGRNRYSTRLPDTSYKAAASYYGRVAPRS